jgi:hypothetical protein
MASLHDTCCASGLTSTPSIAAKDERQVDKGGWEFATLSFPKHWHLALSFTRRVSLGCQFPDATPIRTDVADRFGPAAEPATAGFTPLRGLLGEASGP